MSEQITEMVLPAGPRFSVMRAVRTAIGGVLMGIANLIPGVSGGTMILAVGLYEEFIESVADVTALRLRPRRLAFLGVLGGCAAVAIFGLSKVILYLLLWQPVIMFALFIGLTLGGAPLLMRMIGRPTVGCVIAALIGLGLMVIVAASRAGGNAGLPRNMAMDFASGVIGSMTMVLPGVSGSYVLLVMGQYDRVVGAVDDLAQLKFTALWIVVPVGIGVIVGIAGLSNLLKWLLHRHEKVTLGLLLGILLGSVLGLWPFAQAPTEKILDRRSDSELHRYAQREGISGVEGLIGEELILHIKEHWPTRTAVPYTPRTIGEALIALVVGLLITVFIGRLGSRNSASQQAGERQATMRR